MMSGLSVIALFAMILLTHQLAFENQCASCDISVVGKNGFGHSLAQVIGRHSGALSTFAYSLATTNYGLVWDCATLDSFSTSSTANVPRTSMRVSIADNAVSDKIISYLGTLETAPAAASSSAAAPPSALLAGPTRDELLHAGRDSNDWLYATKDYEGQMFVALKPITTSRAGHLNALRFYRSATLAAIQTNPLVYDGTIYITFDADPVALDATTCRTRWGYTWFLKDGAPSKVNRGAAINASGFFGGVGSAAIVVFSL